jgi:hypothetical protein
MKSENIIDESFASKQSLNNIFKNLSITELTTNTKNISSKSNTSNSNTSNSNTSNNNTSNNNTSNNNKSNNSSSNEEEIDITEYEKKYKLKFQINKKSLNEEFNEINTEKLLEIEEEVIKNNYSYILENITLKEDKILNKEHSILCNGTCRLKHNYNNLIENLKNSKSFKTSDKCYKNNLYYGLKNNIRGVKTIYNLLLRLIVINPKYRNKCKCCITDNDKELLKNFESEFKNDRIVNNNSILYLNFLINKFLGIVSLLPCECKFDKLQSFYNLNYCNYKDYFEIYLKTIPIILLLLKQNHNIDKKNEKYKISLIKQERCIHEDIRYYNNFEYCKYNKYEKELTDDYNINYIINNIEIINEWLKNNFKICNLLLNEQNLRVFKFYINNENYQNNIESLNNIFNKLYKNINIIDINYQSNNNNIFNIILKNNSLKEELVNNSIHFLINKLKEVYKCYNKYDINNFFLIYINQCFTYKKYKYGLEFLKNTENLDIKSSSLEIKINNILNQLITNKDIDIDIKVLYFKIIYKNNINITNVPILDKLIEVCDGDLILSKFEISDNIFINNNFYDNLFLTIEDIINIIKKCLIYKKAQILDYILYHGDEKIKIINKRNNNIINPYQILFINKENDKKNESIYTEFIDVIQKYNYNINENYNKNSNDKCSYLNLCINKNYISLGIKLINYNIIINNLFDNKSIIFHCVDNKNHLIADAILKKNKELGIKLYNGKNIINYLFEKKDDELDENIKLKFILIFLKNNFLNINYQDNINQNIGFLILKSNFKKYNKIILFKIICNQIDPLFKNDRIPLILYSMLLDEFEITYMLMNKLIDSKKILKTTNDGIFSYYLNNNQTNTEYNDEINYIPIILKFIRDFDRSKILDNNIELDIITQQNKCENIIVMIYKIICYFIKYNNDDDIEESLQPETKNKYIKTKKNIVKVNYKKSKFNKKYEEINKYIELSNDNNDDNLLETDTMQNSNIWKTTTLETDSESSEIEVSKICFN